MKRYSLGLVLLFFLSACSPQEVPVQEVPTPSGWETLNQGSFSVNAPAGWVLTPGVGMDSQVGSISGDGITLLYDYGMYAGTFANNSEYSEADYDVEEVLINGFEALIYTPKITGEGLTVLNIASPRQADSFQLIGENLTAEQEEIVLELFKTIFFAQ